MTRLFLLTRTSMLRYLFMVGDTDCSHTSGAAEQHSQAKNAKIAITQSKYSLSRKCESVLSSLIPAYTINKANACYVLAVAMLQQVRTVRLL